MCTKLDSSTRVALAYLLFCLYTVGADTSHLVQWGYPVPLLKVNTEYHDKAPFLSFDGLTLYFSRQDGPGGNRTRIYTARRQMPYDPFVSVDEIDTLNYSGGHIDYPRVSPDNLRMYYYETEGSMRQLKVTERASADDPWRPGISISELNALGQVANPSLTKDELTIVFTGYEIPGGQGGYDLWMATRPDRYSPWADVTNLAEINSPEWDAHPSISPDGLTLHFASWRNGDAQLFKATRGSLEVPFGSPEHLSFFDSPGSSLQYPFLSSDGKTFYYARSDFGEPFDIWVSSQSDLPEAPTYYVSARDGRDTNNGLSSHTAFATIQKAIDTAQDGDVVLVYPGIYAEAIDFKGKPITVQSAADAAVIECPDDFAVSFLRGEGADAVLKNFVITNSETGLFIVRSSPTIMNLTIVGNQYGIEAYANSEPDVSNCIFWNNMQADLIGCQAHYSWVQDDFEAELPSGLVSHWKFDRAQGAVAYDYVSGNHGSIHGANWTAGWTGGALSFDGADDYVSLPDNDPVWLPSDDFALATWVFFERGPASSVDDTEVLLDLNFAAGSAPYNELGCSLQRCGDTGKVCFRVTTTSNSDEDLYTTKPLGRHTWHYIVAVRNGATQSIYVDGRLNSHRTCSSDPVDFVGGYDDDQVSFGRHTSLARRPTYHLQGKLDDVILFDRALLTNEVDALYRNSIARRGFRAGPMFADPHNGDYHLLSERGRYWREHGLWVLDKVTSPCVDAGAPSADYLNEPTPNGGRINLGAYGGTAYASRSEWPFEWDLNYDEIIDIDDLIVLIETWSQSVD